MGKRNLKYEKSQLQRQLQKKSRIISCSFADKKEINSEGIKSYFFEKHGILGEVLKYCKKDFP